LRAQLTRDLFAMAEFLLFCDMILLYLFVVNEFLFLLSRKSRLMSKEQLSKLALPLCITCIISINWMKLDYLFEHKNGSQAQED